MKTTTLAFLLSVICLALMVIMAINDKTDETITLGVFSIISYLTFLDSSNDDLINHKN
jgi:hypothetical protein